MHHRIDWSGVSLAERIAQKRNRTLLSVRPTVEESRRIAEGQRMITRAKARYETGGFSHLAAASVSGRSVHV